MIFVIALPLGKITDLVLLSKQKQKVSFSNSAFCKNSLKAEKIKISTVWLLFPYLKSYEQQERFYLKL